MSTQDAAGPCDEHRRPPAAGDAREPDAHAAPVGHASGDGHAHGPRIGSAGARHQRPLAIAFLLTAAYALVEVAAGALTGSLALISDAAHMGTDVLGLGLALAAIQLAKRRTLAARR